MIDHLSAARASHTRLRAYQSVGLLLGVALGWASPARAMGPEDDAAPRRRIVFDAQGHPASLERHEPVWNGSRWAITWRTVCVSPCVMDVPSTGLYRVGGRGVTNSAGFQLPDTANEIHLQANPGSSSRRTLGLVGASGAGLLTLTSLWLVASTSGCNQTLDPHCESVRFESAAGSMALALLLGAGSVYWLLTSGTEVSLAETPLRSTANGQLLGRFRVDGLGVVF